MKYEELKLIDNKEQNSFELIVDEQRSFIDYQKKQNKVYLLHTEVPESQKGLGIAAALVEKTFRYLDAGNVQIVPLCSYVLSFLRRHPEWDRLVNKKD